MKTPLRFLFPVAVASFFGAAVLAAGEVHHGTGAAHAKKPATEWARSPEELVDRFLAALAARDEAALSRLRVDEHEYRGTIIPGTVAPGAPLRNVSTQPSEYFWRMLDTKSRDYAAEFVSQWGGKSLSRRGVRFGQTQHYRGYDAFGPTEITVADASGGEQKIQTGWLAKLGDRYKFIGYQWD